MKKIGLVGGLSWVSTIDYYRYINEEVNRRLGGLNFAECMLYSVNFADIQQRTWENSFDIVLNACESLKKSGADAIALCANTAHLFADELEAKTGLPLIHIGIETASAIRQQGLTKVGLLGTKFTMEMDFYIRKLEEHGLQILIPQKQETRDYIQYTINEEIGRGVIKTETRQLYISIVQYLEQQGANGFILGCTEIPLLFSQEDFSMPVFVTSKFQTQYIVDFMLS